MTSNTLGPAGAMSGAARLAPRGAADWLHLAAAPTFASMALFTAVHGGGMPDMMCGGEPDALPLNGMALMYLLMSVFHAGPWLKLVSSRFGLGERSLRFEPGMRHDNER